MSGKHTQPSNVNYEDEVTQLFLALKRQKLAAKIHYPGEENAKRLRSDFNVVAGRKLDQVRNTTRLRLLGQGKDTEYTKEYRLKRVSYRTPDIQKPDEDKLMQQLQEKLKNFSFHSTKEIEPTDLENASVKLVILTKSGEKDEAPSNTKKENKLQKQKKTTTQYLLDHMYFVLDTNVLIHNLYLMENVSKLVLFGTAGSVLYVPYMTIKELDILKHRKETAFNARRAIEYLNDKFDDSDGKIEAQSALQDAEKLIDIDSPDDRILNCCLQLKAKVPHTMLLTNDNNLRLKANASKIRVSTCVNLLKLKANWWSLPRQRRPQRHLRFKVRVWE